MLRKRGVVDGEGRSAYRLIGGKGLDPGQGRGLS